MSTSLVKDWDPGTQAKVIHKHCLAACPNAVIKKYNSNLSAANCKDFDDVNKAWANVDILSKQLIWPSLMLEFQWPPQ